MSNDLREVEGASIYEALTEDVESVPYRKLAAAVLTRALFDAAVYYGSDERKNHSQRRMAAFGYANGQTYFVCDPDLIRFWCLAAGIPPEKFHRALKAIEAGRLNPKTVRSLTLAMSRANCHKMEERTQRAYDDYIQQAYQ